MVWEASELSASAIELLGVAIIVIAIVHGTGRFLFHMQQRVEDAYEQYKVQLAKALLLAWNSWWPLTSCERSRSNRRSTTSASSDCS